MKIAEYLTCDPLSPSGLRWIAKKGQRGVVGGVAGHYSAKGYWYVTFDKRQIKAHRIVYYLNNGIWPKITN